MSLVSYFHSFKFTFKISSSSSTKILALPCQTNRFLTIFNSYGKNIRSLPLNPSFVSFRFVAKMTPRFHELCVVITGRNEVVAKVMFLQASVILLTGGGRAWLLGGACMVGHRGGMRGWSWGGMRGWSRGGRAWLVMGGHAWLVTGGHAWLLMGGGMRGCAQGGCVFFFLNEVRSMSGRYASYWNAFLLLLPVASLLLQ